MKFSAKTPDRLKQFSQELSLIKEDKKIPWILYDPKTKEFSLDINCLSGFIKNNTNILFIRNKATEKTLKYLYIDGVYKNVSDDEIMAAIKQYIPQSLMSSRAVKEIFFDITTQNKFIKVEELDDYENLINFKDGLYDIEEDVLLPHSPNILSSIQIPTYYNEIKNAPDEAPVFDNYLATLCGIFDSEGNLVRDEKKEFLLLQVIGLTISNYYGYRTKKALFLEGVGDSGKSQIKALVEGLIGSENYSTASLQDLGERFGMSSVYGKRLVGSNDMSDETIQNIKDFKSLTGGDNVRIEFKHNASFDYKFRGILWNNCNKMPLFYGDKGKWVYERIINVKCRNAIPKEKQDKKILEKMMNEKNSIIKKALVALKRLVEDKFNFIYVPEIEINRDNFEIKNSTLLSFVEECCVIDKDEKLKRQRTSRKAFKEAYSSFVDFNFEGKGLTKWNDCMQILNEKFGCEIIKSNGTMCLTKIKLNPAAIKEYVYVDDLTCCDLKEEQKKQEIENKIKQDIGKAFQEKAINELQESGIQVNVFE